MQGTHHILWVPIRVKPECVEEFVRIADENVQKSRQEPGVVRFDVLRNKEDETSFTLLEIYEQPEGHARHQQTEHYKNFKANVASLLQKPYTRGLYEFVVPD